MPNTLVHLGIQGAANRYLAPKFDLPLVFLGCVIPDIPWILRRIIEFLNLQIDPHVTMMYATVQASLAFCVVLAIAISLLMQRISVALLILVFNSLLHLALDALESKPGNGVVFFAPYSWDGIQFDLLWPNNPIIIAVSIVSLVYVVYLLFLSEHAVSMTQRLRPRNVILAALMICLYMLAPVWLLEFPLENNNHYAKTLLDVDSRPGKTIEIDRGQYRRDGRKSYVTTYAGEEFGLIGTTPEFGTAISLSGQFTDGDTINVRSSHVSSPRVRDLASFIGLFIVCAFWIRYFLPNRKNSVVSESGG